MKVGKKLLGVREEIDDNNGTYDERLCALALKKRIRRAGLN